MCIADVSVHCAISPTSGVAFHTLVKVERIGLILVEISRAIRESQAYEMVNVGNVFIGTATITGDDLKKIATLKISMPCVGKPGLGNFPYVEIID
jgi:hypothetical protein